MQLASSTVSEQVKKLEESLSLTLLERRGREMVLSSDGERVFSYAREMFDKGKRLVDNLSFNDVAGYSVKVSLESHLDNQPLNEFLKKYWKKYSSFGLVETKRSKNLSQSIYFLEHDVVDWVITSSDIIDSRFERVKLGELSYSFYCSEQVYNFFKRGSKETRDILKKLPLGRFGTIEKVEEDISHYFHDISLYPKEQFFSEHADFLMNLCLDGEIVLFMPSMGEDSPEGLKKIDFDSNFSKTLYGMYKKSNSQLLYIRKLRELLSELNIQGEESSHLPYFNFNSWRPVDDKLN